MWTGPLLCGVLCACVHLVLARTYSTQDQQSQANNTGQLDLTKRSVYYPSWLMFYLSGLHSLPCEQVQLQVSSSYLFQERIMLNFVCPYVKRNCDEIVRQMTSEVCQVSIVASAVGGICNCASTPVVAVNGNWGEWSDVVWDQCTVACGVGTERYIRHRSCNNPAPQNGGAACNGDTATGPFTRSCSKPACTNEPVDGGWSAWSETLVSECTATCGGGTEVFSLSRDCNTPTPANGGRACEGQATGTRTNICNTQACINDGNWGSWGAEVAVSTCNATCGGGQIIFRRTRSCNNPAPSSGGQDCVGSATLDVSRTCNEQGCPNDGNWGSWGAEVAVSTCNATCGGGQMIFRRTRSCNNPAPSSGGQDCVGSATLDVSRTCNEQGCPTDGNWGSWGAEVAVSTCNATCGGGQIIFRRTRSCNNPAPSSGGQDCVGSATLDVSRTCNEQGCPIDGMWSEWSTSSTSTCSVSCGGGTQTRTDRRVCNSPAPSNGGALCSGDAERSQTFICNTAECSVVQNGGWSPWVDVPVTECTTPCGGGRQNVTRQRTCTNPPPINGQPCDGSDTGLTFEKACNAEDAQICPQAACLTSRIVGGMDVDPPCKYPFSVGLRRFGSASCGASLIGPNKVLTAAHCVVGLQASALLVEVGKHCSSTTGSASYNSRNPNMEVMEVEEFVIHPNFVSGAALFFDLAVLKLKKDVITTKCRQIVQMAPSSQVTQTGRTCTVIGWGTLSYNGGAASILQEVDLELYDSEDCRTTFSSTATVVDNNIICAANGINGGEDACRGDSGSPLICQDNNEWVQYGIVSSGFECARPNQAGLYTEVAAFRTWIDSQFV